MRFEECGCLGRALVVGPSVPGIDVPVINGKVVFCELGIRTGVHMMEQKRDVLGADWNSVRSLYVLIAGEIPKLHRVLDALLGCSVCILAYSGTAR